MRCKTLADELRRSGAEVLFVCRKDTGHLIELLVSDGYAVTALAPRAPFEQTVDAEDTVAAVERSTADWLVVDHYELDERWELQLRPHVRRMLVIDDLANRRHVCDVLLDQSWCGKRTPLRYRHLVEQAECLLGPRYALLQPAFAQLREGLSPRDGAIRRVLVFFGAVDSANQTVKTLLAFQAREFQNIQVDVVVGQANPNLSTIEVLASDSRSVKVHRELPTLANLMAAADVMLGAGGGTTWERCCLGLPALVVVSAENQRETTHALAEAGVHRLLGDASAIEAQDWQHGLRELMSSPELVRTYSIAARQLTDGLGAQRVAAVLRGSCTSG